MSANASIGRIREIARKEFHQIRRDPRFLRVIFVAPVIQLLVFGYAVSTDVRQTRLFVVDHDRTRASRDLVEALTAGGYFRVTGSSSRPADMVDALDHGDAVVGLEIPADFAARSRDGSGATVQLIVDGTNSNIAITALGYAERIVQRWGARLMPEIHPAVDLRERAWFNPDLASRNYNIPGVLGTIIFMVCLLLTALAVVREREIGTLEQLMVSPVRPLELIAGKTIPFALIGLFDLVVITTLALLWFKVPFAGNFFLLFLACVLFILSALGFGLFVSTVSRTQQEAFMLALLIFMPVMLLSGFVFPVRSMPEVFQWITLLNPLRHFLHVVRAIFLKGVGLSILWPQYLTLLIMGMGVLGFAASRFHKTIR